VTIRLGEILGHSRTELQAHSYLLEQMGDYQGAMRDMEESIDIHRANTKPGVRGQNTRARSLAVEIAALRETVKQDGDD